MLVKSKDGFGFETEQLDEAEASQEHAENEPMEVAKEVVVNEMTLSASSAMKDFRAAAKRLGVSGSGSTQRIFDS